MSWYITSPCFCTCFPPQCLTSYFPAFCFFTFSTSRRRAQAWPRSCRGIPLYTRFIICNTHTHIHTGWGNAGMESIVYGHGHCNIVYGADLVLTLSLFWYLSHFFTILSHLFTLSISWSLCWGQRMRKVKCFKMWSTNHKFLMLYTDLPYIVTQVTKWSSTWHDSSVLVLRDGCPAQFGALPAQTPSLKLTITRCPDPGVLEHQTELDTRTRIEDVWIVFR